MPGVSEAASAAACAKRFDGPITKVSKVNFGFRCVGTASARESAATGERCPFFSSRGTRPGWGSEEPARERGFFFLLFFLRFHEFQGRIDRDGDAYGASEVHGQGGRQLVLRLIFDPLLREAVRNGQEDRPFDIAERARGAQHRRRNGTQFIGGNCVEGDSPRACEGIRLHDYLRTQYTVNSVTT